MVKKADIPKHVIETAMNLAAERGWRDLSLADIAEAAELPLSQVYPVFPSKQAILDGFLRQIDAQVLAEQEPEALEGSARDRLFDVLMRRFDALGPYRTALGNILYDQARDPLASLCALPRFGRSMASMLEAARLSTTGLRGLLRTEALGATYLSVLRVWLRDESEDKGRTMAALDRALARLERAARCCSRARQATA